MVGTGARGGGRGVLLSCGRVRVWRCEKRCACSGVTRGGRGAVSLVLMKPLVSVRLNCLPSPLRSSLFAFFERLPGLASRGICCGPVASGSQTGISTLKSQTLGTQKVALYFFDCPRVEIPILGSPHRRKPKKRGRFGIRAPSRPAQTAISTLVKTLRKRFFRPGSARVEIPYCESPVSPNLRPNLCCPTSDPEPETCAH